MCPFQRGKRPNLAEFGQKMHLSVVNRYTYLEQTIWSNFNEDGDLEAAVEDYFRKFGCYPSAVLADRIYRTRRNKMFCTQLGLRLVRWLALFFRSIFRVYTIPCFSADSN